PEGRELRVTADELRVGGDQGGRHQLHGRSRAPRPARAGGPVGAGRGGGGSGWGGCGDGGGISGAAVSGRRGGGAAASRCGGARGGARRCPGRGAATGGGLRPPPAGGAGTRDRSWPECGREVPLPTSGGCLRSAAPG